MDFPDYAIFGTARGHFAQGTGRLGFARTRDDAFEFRQPRDADQIIPRLSGITLLRRPLKDPETGLAFDFIAMLIKAVDLRGRDGFLGVGVLLDQSNRTEEGFTAAQVELRRLIDEAARKFLDDSDAFTADFEPSTLLPSTQQDEAVTQLVADETDPIVAYSAGIWDFEESKLGRALFATSMLNESKRSLVAITSDSQSEYNELSDELLRDAETRLQVQIEFERAQQEEQEKRKVLRQHADLVSRVDELEAEVAKLKLRVSHISNLGDTNDADRVAGATDHTVQRRGPLPQIGDPDPNAMPSMDMTSNMRLSKWVLASIAVLVCLAALAAIWSIAGNQFGGTNSAPSEQDQQVAFSFDCQSAQNILANSSIGAGSPSEQMLELISCVRSDFSGFSSRQNECEGFESVARDLWGDDLPERQDVPGLRDAVTVCFPDDE